MKILGICIISLFLFSACDDTKKAGDSIARDVTGANLINQGKLIQDKARALGEAQKKRMDQMPSE